MISDIENEGYMEFCVVCGSFIQPQDLAKIFGNPFCPICYEIYCKLTEISKIGE